MRKIMTILSIIFISFTGHAGLVDKSFANRRAYMGRSGSCEIFKEILADATIKWNQSDILFCCVTTRLRIIAKAYN